MAKTIGFEYQGTHYTLEFTRKSVKKMEDGGFDVTLVEHKPMTMYPKLFEGAFIAHHPFVKKTVTDAIYAKLNNKAELMDALSDMYSDTLMSILDEPAESEGNVTWETNV